MKIENTSEGIRCKIYLSDEGFGPVVRESAIIEGFRDIRDDIHFTMQTERCADSIGQFVDDVSVIKRFNNIVWAKEDDGAPCAPKIKVFFSDYLRRTEDFIATELAEFDYHFVLSDFVYEAFHAACKRSAPAFGVAHFTWDWFFSKIFPPPLTDRVLARFFECAEAADVIYFPPFTPREILSHYRHKAKQVPLIVRKLRHKETVEKNPKFKVLIMDSGGRVVAPHIQRALYHVQHLPNFHFYVSSRFACEADNVSFIEPNEVFSDYIPHMDLVISRGGFNTISECIAYRTPILLIGEAVNPEMDDNMISVKKAQFGSFLSLNTLVNELSDFLPRFVEHEYKHIANIMANHDMPSNGAAVIADDIVNRIL